MKNNVQICGVVYRVRQNFLVIFFQSVTILPAKDKKLSARSYEYFNEHSTNDQEIKLCMSDQTFTPNKIEKRIYEIRGKKVILDFDLAKLYGVETRVLVQAVKRNQKRFPDDFIFQLNKQEVIVLKSQFVISSSWGGRRRSLPYAFTEHGAVMAATVLNSPIAVDTSIMVVRAFMRLREMLLEQDDLKKYLRQLEHQIAKRFSEHEKELREIRFLIHKLEQPPTPQKRPLGFRQHSDRNKK